ncbi:MAG TPA: biotin/lipoyl-containing protein [Actinomycetota bacterium]|nr:biotin/lipoyl-containing protein [Actinomycetota bacterium]
MTKGDTTFRVLVSPAAGRLRFLPPKRFERGMEVVEAGQPIARVVQGKGDLMVRAPFAGRVSAVMGLEGEPVQPGHALVAIEPHA